MSAEGEEQFNRCVEGVDLFLGRGLCGGVGGWKERASWLPGISCITYDIIATRRFGRGSYGGLRNGMKMEPYASSEGSDLILFCQWIAPLA